MKLQEIKAAVDAGLIVHWKTGAYRVINHGPDCYRIHCNLDNDYFGLDINYVTLKAKPEDFYFAPGQGITARIFGVSEDSEDNSIAFQRAIDICSRKGPTHEETGK